MLSKNWYLQCQKEFQIFSFCICKFSVTFYLLNEIQPKTKFWNIVQYPINWCSVYDKTLVFLCYPQIKKLVYVYLVRYAEEQQDLALLSISTFQKGLKVGALCLRKIVIIKIMWYVQPLLRITLPLLICSSVARPVSCFACWGHLGGGSFTGLNRWWSYRRQIDIVTYQVRNIKAYTSLCLFVDDMCSWSRWIAFLASEVWHCNFSALEILIIKMGYLPSVRSTFPENHTYHP